MRPTIGESLATARRALATVIVPELTSAYAKAKAVEIDLCLSIASKSWASFYPQALEERDDLIRLLGVAAERLARSLERHPSSLLSRLRDELAERIAARPQTAKYPTFQELSAECDSYKAALTEIVLTLEEVDARGESDEETRPLRQMVRAAIRKSLSHLPAPTTRTGKLARASSVR